DQGKGRFENILEVGSGPVGIVSFLNWGKRYAVDPLEDFYRTNPALCEVRDSEVSYIKGCGESLPFEDGFFYLVILDNVLDHVQNATKVLDEIYRVLSREGALFLSVNVHTMFGGLLHSILVELGVDKGHPYTFTVESIRDFIQSRGFSILSEFVDGYYDARRRDRGSRSFKDKMKGYTGLSEFIYSAVCVKR
ncbi:MAG: class I SAM-dependent methyltransferase, partial [Fervidobacterium sp.]